MFSSRTVRILFKQFNSCKVLSGEGNCAYYGRTLRKSDAGIAARKTLVDDKEEFKELDDHDFDLEANFVNVGSAYDQDARERAVQREHLKHLIVRQRYFKEKLPNFLSWSDKEQIRHLHRTNPEEWTIERLSEGFPVLPDVVVKIIKGTWKKTAQHKIINHDKSVEENWKLFNEGKMRDLSPDVVEHLQKFSGRKSISTSTESSVALVNDRVGRELPKTRSTEFLDIIRSYRKDNKSDTAEPVEANKRSRDPNLEQDSYVENHTKDRKHSTLSKFTEKLVRKSEKGSIKPNEEFMLKTLEKKQEDLEITEGDFEIEGKPVTALKSLNETKYNNEVSKVVKKKVTVLETYPEQIRIPKVLYKPGATYKLNDCYYDDDGEFLYRVPGMSK